MKRAIVSKGIDLVVEPYKYKKTDIELMSKIISHYKVTGELLKLGNTPIKTKRKKELIAKP